MPSLRPLTDVARTDAKFFADSVIPAIAAAGFEGSVALLVTDAPDACVGDVVSADIIVEGKQADIEALLAGKQKTELSALDKLKAAKNANASAGVAGIVVRGSLDSLRAFLAAVSPREKSTGGAKDVASEKGATPEAKQADTMRLPNGRIVKGRPGGKRAAAPSTPSAPKPNVVGAQKSGATDRVAFAVQNVAGFIAAGVAKVEAAAAESADEAHGVWLIAVGEVRRG